MATIKRFEEIGGWKKARELVKCVYAASNAGAFARDFELRSQLRRTAVSVMSNTAEGFGRHGDKDFAHFLSIAQGSALAVQSLLYVALDLAYLEQAEFDKLSRLADEAAALIIKFASYRRPK
jgi:four helix bundle protein